MRLWVAFETFQKLHTFESDALIHNSYLSPLAMVYFFMACPFLHREQKILDYFDQFGQWPMAKMLRIYALFSALFFILRYFIRLVLKWFSKIFQSTLLTQVPSPRSRCLTLHRLTALNGYYQATAAPLAETPPSAQNRSNGAQKWAETLQAPPFRHYPPNVFSLKMCKIVRQA